MNETFDSVLKAEKLTGKKVRITNPSNGADIYCKKHYAGYDFNLKSGDFKDVDEAIAKSAKYVWNFLRISEITSSDNKIASEEKVKNINKDDLVTEINSVDTEFIYPTEFDIHAQFLITRYAFHIQQQIAKGLGIKGWQSMKKDKLHTRILERGLNELVDVAVKLQIPFYTI